MLRLRVQGVVPWRNLQSQGDKAVLGAHGMVHLQAFIKVPELLSGPGQQSHGTLGRGVPHCNDMDVL